MTRTVCQLSFVMGFTITLSASMLCATCDKARALDVDKLPWEERSLFEPSLSELAEAFRAGLNKNYANVAVKIVDCPDLTKSPFYLASSGLSGSEVIFDIGADTYSFPTPKLEKVYDLRAIARKAIPNANMISLNGAGAGPYELKNSCSEGIYSVKMAENGSFVSESRVAFIEPSDNSFNMERIPSSETTVSFLNNAFASEGKKGKVIHIKAKKRVGEEASFVMACQKAAKDAFGNKTVGIGGVFVINAGEALYQVRPNCTEPIDSVEALQRWYRLQMIRAPLSSVGTFLTDAMDLEFRLQHFHSFSISRGGHYFNDTTPDTIEYEAIFNVAKRIIRVDRPQNSPSFLDLHN